MKNLVRKCLTLTASLVHEIYPSSAFLGLNDNKKIKKDQKIFEGQIKASFSTIKWLILAKESYKLSRLPKAAMKIQHTPKLPQNGPHSAISAKIGKN